MINPPTYLISSHISYLDALRRLLSTMNHIEPRRKWVYIGGADRQRIVCVNGLPCFEVDHNSFDYTALIEWAARANGNSHVFLLHDTMEFGADSDALIRQADPDMEATAAYPGGQTNLVCYRTDYLLGKYEYIQSLRNIPKLGAIQHEGRLWSMTEKRACYANARVTTTDAGNPYGGAHRLCETYHAVDIRKLKANYGKTMSPDHFELRM